MKIIKDIANKEYSLSAIDDSVSFVVPSEENKTLLIKNLKEENDITFDILDNSHVQLSFLADREIRNLKITANLGKNAELEVFFADFSRNTNNCEVVVNLNEEGARLNWHLASLADKNDKKNISVSANHKAPNTFAKVENYGVAKDESHLVFAGTSHILNGAIKSNTLQTAKIMVFDEQSVATAKPILKIDENDIAASHNAVVGKISDEHLFYLTSRGISLGEAKMIITLGYLKPIFKGFDEKSVEYINALMEERI